ncbi:hypothetical protein M3649_03550 [Ureibacillus chungkukjangi]|uniref:hypothetical protein n=1 Tax=Ureibacillus chungkukjangi TaxID=1202712 RepID=UPI00203CA747|nr:hypothetical protein [Ureibacillus chungkukjangi]MCM3387205.1 hypothetical protein [Ureibacillus chungkukjangi]
MTCIVGLLHNGVTYMGCDSLASNGHFKDIRNDKKMFKPDKRSIIGFTSSYRMGQLLMHEDNLFDDYTYLSHRYMVRNFIPKVIRLFEDGKFDINGNNGGVFLIAHSKKLYRIDTDYQVIESKRNYSSCGCGEEFALGSLYSTEDSELNPQERITKALEAAEQFSVGVQRPFYIMNTENDEVIEIK